MNVLAYVRVNKSKTYDVKLQQRNSMFSVSIKTIRELEISYDVSGSVKTKMAAIYEEHETENL